MNAKRRKSPRTIVGYLNDLQAVKEKIEEAIGMVADEEQEAYDNMPESLQESERGQTMSENIDDLQAAIDDLQCFYTDDIISRLEDVCDR